MTTDITELTPEAARESGSILIIVAARMARREFFTPLHALCESGQRVVSTRALCDAVERAEEHMVSQVSKIVDGHDRLTKKLKEAESRNAELVEALEKAQAGEKHWREVVDAFCTDDADWHNLTNSNNELIALLSQALCEQADRIAELESKLAHPVQLPKTNGYWTEQEKAYEEAITLAKRQIRVAGFRCEGDE